MNKEKKRIPSQNPYPHAHGCQRHLSGTDHRVIHTGGRPPTPTRVDRRGSRKPIVGDGGPPHASYASTIHVSVWIDPRIHLCPMLAASIQPSGPPPETLRNRCQIQTLGAVARLPDAAKARASRVPTRIACDPSDPSTAGVGASHRRWGQGLTAGPGDQEKEKEPARPPATHTRGRCLGNLGRREGGQHAPCLKPSVTGRGRADVLTRFLWSLDMPPATLHHRLELPKWFY